MEAPRAREPPERYQVVDILGFHLLTAGVEQDGADESARMSGIRDVLIG